MSRFEGQAYASCAGYLALAVGNGRHATLRMAGRLLRVECRAQVSQRLKERGFDAGGDEAYGAACYAAKVRPCCWPLLPLGAWLIREGNSITDAIASARDMGSLVEIAVMSPCGSM